MKPCPFCGGDNTTIQGEPPSGKCLDCAAWGPDRPTWQEAEVAWNQRPGEAALRERVATEREACARLVERLPVGSGLTGRTYAEAIRGVGMGGKLASQHDLIRREVASEARSFAGDRAEIAALREAVREGWGIISTESAFEFPSGRACRWYELPCVVRALEE